MSQRITISILGVAVAFVGLVVMTDYLLGGMGVKVWLGQTPMAFNTAFLMVLIGVALTIIGCTNRIWRRR